MFTNESVNVDTDADISIKGFNTESYTVYDALEIRRIEEMAIFILTLNRIIQFLSLRGSMVIMKNITKNLKRTKESLILNGV